MTGLLILLAVAGLLLLIILSGTIAWEVRHPDRRTDAYAMARGYPVDPREAGLEFTAWSLHRPGGVSLPVWEVECRPRSADAADRPPLTVLFLHGWGSSKIDMLARRSPFDELADRLVFFDHRGHGEADGKCTLGTREVDDVMAAIDRLGACRLIIVGHSMGGVLAITAGRHLQERADGAAQLAGVIATGPYTSTLVPMRNRLRALGHPSIVLPELAFAMLWVRGVRDVTTLRDVAELRVPLLLMVGDRDVITPLDEVRKIADAASDATLAVLPDAGHGDAHEKAPHDQDEAVRSFLSSIELSTRRDIARD